MRRKVIILIVCALLTVLLIPILYYLVYVPYAFGKQYVSVSFRPFGFSYDHRDVEVVYNGDFAKIGRVGIYVNVTNRYLLPVHVKYNGFDVVWLIYTQTVSDPSDVVNNSNALVWGGFYHLVFTSYSGHKYTTFTRGGFDYYASRRELSNFTKTIEAGAYMRKMKLFNLEGVDPVWRWEYWFNSSSYVPTGTYYMYCIIFGIACGPQNFTITSVPW